MIRDILSTLQNSYSLREITCRVAQIKACKSMYCERSSVEVI